MRAALAAVLVLPLTGCFDFDLDFTGQSIAIASRDFQLTISGCANDGLLGCGDGGGAGGRMEAVLDGATRLVPAYEPAPLELFPSRGFQLTVPSPDDPDVKVILNGQGVHVEELPWFDLELARPGIARRAAGPARLVFDAFRDARVEAVMTTHCGSRMTESFDTIDPTHVGDGFVDVAFDNPTFDGDCTHELRVTQTVSVDNHVDIWLTSARTVRQTFSSSR